MPSGIPDPVEFTRALVRRRSVTPADDGALDILSAQLSGLGFHVTRLPFGDGSERIDNLYARWGAQAPNFCFAGHTDVVPPGDEARWSAPPFDAQLRDGCLIGRGAADMKGAIAAFVAAAARAIAKTPKGSISLLITGDEEGASINGTEPMVRWLKEHGERIDHCLLGEPTSETQIGDMIKIGRRASLNAEITFAGTQGHVAYPHLARNPLPALIALLDHLARHALDTGTEHFQPSNLEIVSVDTGNAATNIIPASARARLNIRFNNLHTRAALQGWLKDEIERAALIAELECIISFSGNGEAFFTAPGAFAELIADAIDEILGRRPALSTLGGTSDARFIHALAPIVEFGLVGQTMHKIDEQVPVADIARLTQIYERILERYFASPPG